MRAVTEVEKMLRERDYRQVLEAVRDLNVPRSLDDFRSCARHVAAQLVGCETAALCELDTQSGRLTGMLQPLSLEENRRWLPVLNSYLHQNPTVAYLKAHPDSPTVRLADFISQRALRNTALYNEVYRHVAIEQQLLVNLQTHGANAVCITLHRAHCGFSLRECALLETLQPHLVQGYANALRFSQKLNTTEHRVLVVSKGRIVFCSDEARRILRFYCGEIGVHIPTEIARWLRAQNAVSLAVAAPFRCQKGARTLSLRVVEYGEGGAVLSLEESVPRHDWSFEMLSSRERSGDLTLRQSEVLQLLSRGMSNAQIASHLDLSAHTVRHHLEAIYDKLEVSNRNAAARRARELCGFVR